jgi:osmotically-inducible protein OsmY
VSSKSPLQERFNPERCSCPDQSGKRVAGVVGIVNDIEVRLPIIHRRPDPEIARDAVEAIKRELPLSWEKIKAIVEDGWITLEGDVEWHYQRERAEEAVQGLRGVRGVVNKIEVRPQVPPVEIKSRIEQALRRAAELDASRISVEANGSEIIFAGCRAIVGRARAGRAPPGARRASARWTTA